MKDRIFCAYRQAKVQFYLGKFHLYQKIMQDAHACKSNEKENLFDTIIGKNTT